MAMNAFEMTIPSLKFVYRNHRGELSERSVYPRSIRYGNTQWHPENQWLLKAFDAHKQAEREFAIKDILQIL